MTKKQTMSKGRTRTGSTALTALLTLLLSSSTSAGEGSTVTDVAAAEVTTAERYPSIQLIVPTPKLLIDKIDVETLVTGSDIRTVELWLNGQLATEIRRPPFLARIDVGPEPREHELGAVARDGEGRMVARDRVRLNAGRHLFDIRLLSPTGLQPAGGEIYAHAQVKVPEGAELDRVEIFLGDQLHSTLEQPPFVQPIAIPPEDPQATYVRAVAHLQDGRSTHTLQLVQAPSEGDEVERPLVELYATVTRGRTLVPNLTRDSFKIFEEGEPQQVEGFEYVNDLPIHVVLLMDASRSMHEALHWASASALSFLEAMLTELDRAAVIRFDHQIHLMAPFTNDMQRLQSDIRNLTSGGGSRLYDGLIQAMYYCAGIEGKRAVVVLSDGPDRSSQFDFQQVLDYSLRSGVGIYTISIETSTTKPPMRHIKQLRILAEQTGGHFFRIQTPLQLTAAYEEIRQELRSQYLLTYSAPKGKDGLRRVRVETDGLQLEVQTRQGYITQ